MVTLFAWKFRGAVRPDGICSRQPRSEASLSVEELQGTTVPAVAETDVLQ